MNKEKMQLIQESIAAEREAWAALSPDQRIEKIRADQLKAQEEADKKESVAQDQLDSILVAFAKLAKGIVPMTREQELEYRWKHRVKTTMEEHGIELRNCRRIAPNWNCRAQEMVFEKVKKHCIGAGAVVILAGSRGAGKTTITAQLMRERIEAWCEWNDTPQEERTGNPPMEAGQYEKLARLGAMFKPLYSDFGSIGAERLNGIFETWCECPFVVIDEIHEAEDLKSAMRMMVDLIDRRYAKRLDTILISNHEPEDCQRELNASILSRVHEHGAIIPCKWESWRAKK